jgi:parvulin-like peptidyl-prolyl isomerase
MILAIFLGACGGEPARAPSLPAEAKATSSLAPVGVEEAPDDGWEATTDKEIIGPRARARHILVAYSEAVQAPATVSRSKDEARQLAEKVRADILDGGDFVALCKAHSDGGTANRGGELGTFGKGVMHSAFEAAVFGLEVGALSGVVETPFGFHVIEREPVVEVRVAQILVQWKGRHLSKTSRSKEAARVRADEALALIRSGRGMREVAKTHSDGDTGKRGTDLGWFQKGQMVPAFDEAAFALMPGQTSEVIESPLGFHIIHRLE